MPEISRWYHSNGRKQRGTEEPLDDGEEKNEKELEKLKQEKLIEKGVFVVTNGKINK